MVKLIYTLTFNPCIDLFLTVGEIKNGSINRASKESVLYGGKGINVSLVLKELDMPSKALGFISGFTGDAIEKHLKEKKIKTDFIRLESGFTRINVKLRNETETDINGCGPDITDSAVSKLIKKLSKLKNNDFLIISGKIPEAFSEATFSVLLNQLKSKGIKFIIDTSGTYLSLSLKHAPFLIKPNKEELEEITGACLDTPEKIKNTAFKLQQAGAKNILVSLGKDGAVLLDETGTFYDMPAFKGDCVDTVGAGDSMVAGFLAGYLSGKGFEYALKLSVACGSATAFTFGLAEKDKIFELFER